MSLMFPTKSLLEIVTTLTTVPGWIFQKYRNFCDKIILLFCYNFNRRKVHVDCVQYRKVWH